MYALFVPTEKEALSLFGSADFFYKDGLKCFHWREKTVYIAGFGKTHAARTAALYLATGGQGIPFLAGIAGAYRASGLEPGVVGFIRKNWFVDEALYTGDKLTGTDEMGFPVSDNNSVELFVPDFQYPSYEANTVSLLPGTDELAALYHNKTGAALESMEGGAFALSALLGGRRVVEVRAVSNYCGDRKNASWDIKKAIKNLRELLDNLYPELISKQLSKF